MQYRILLLLIILFNLAFLNGCKSDITSKSEVRGNTVGNIINEGIVAYEDGWIYYSNIQDEGKLYKKQSDGSNVTLLSNKPAIYINVVDNWVYYSTGYSRPGGAIYKITIDGNEETQLNRHNSSYVQVVDDWIYYTHFLPKEGNEHFYLYKMRTDGSDPSMIVDAGRNLNVVDGWAYYSSTNGIHKVRIDGSDQTKLVSDIEADYLNVADDWIYFTHPGGNVYKVKTDGTNLTQLNEDISLFLNLDNDWVYFANALDNWSIYRVRTDGSDCELINDESAIRGIFVAGERIYYVNKGQLKWFRKDTPMQ